MLQIFLLAFADDAVLLSHNVDGLKYLLSAFVKFCTEKGLQVNVKKTKAMLINMKANFVCNDKPIENVSEFKYLGLVIDKSKKHPGKML